MASRRSFLLFLPWISSITKSSSAGTKLLAPVSPFALHPPSDLCLLLSDGLLLSPLIHLLLRPPILLLSGHCVRKRGCTAGGEAATVAMEHHRHRRHGDVGCGAPLRILISIARTQRGQSGLKVESVWRGRGKEALLRPLTSLTAPLSLVLSCVARFRSRFPALSEARKK